MRLKLRPAVHYAPVREGVYFGTERGSFVMRGPAALFQVVDLCVPLLEDGADEDGLVGALGGEQARPIVGRLLGVFDDHGLLLDQDALSVSEPAPEVRERYREALTDLETTHEDPYAAFARLRAATVLVTGPVEAVLPAARGLDRAGVGHLVLAVPDASDAAPTAFRLGASVETLTGAGVAVVADAAVVCAPAEELAEALARQAALLPPGSVLVPVRLGRRFHLAGPLGDTGGEVLAARVARWAAAEGGTEDLARPSADALAGALAARLVFRAITDGTDADAYVVHGAGLAADAVDLSAGGRPQPATDLDEAVGVVQSLASRWTGALHLVTPHDLPQLPLALAEVAHRAVTAGSVVAWGADQRSATVSAALTALRRQSGTGLTRGGDPATVSAAALSEQAWLLDGALRLLADRARKAEGQLGFDDLDKAARVLWRTLEDYELVRITVELRAVDGLDWPLAGIRDAVSGESLGEAWGTGPVEAVSAALSTALARVQTRRARGADLVGEAPDTTVLIHTAPERLAALAQQVGALVRLSGERRTDPLAGELPVWYGPVSVFDAAGAAQNEEQTGEDA